MNGWWHGTVTNGDLVLYFTGWIIFYAAKELISGFIQGWKRRGKQRKRDERGQAGQQPDGRAGLGLPQEPRSGNQRHARRHTMPSMRTAYVQDAEAAL
jgi:hypothetical protein